jgi:hypothetical protein
MTTQAVPTVSAMFMELSRKFATKSRESVSVKTAMARLVAIAVFQAFTIIPNASRVIARWLALSRQFVITTESARACRILLESAAINVWPVSINSQSACLATATHMVLSAYRVTMKANVTAKTTLTVRTVTRVGKISTTIHSARAAIVTLLE